MSRNQVPKRLLKYDEKGFKYRIGYKEERCAFAILSFREGHHNEEEVP